MLRSFDEGKFWKIGVAVILLHWVLTVDSQSVRSGGRMSLELRGNEWNDFNEVKSLRAVSTVECV